MDCFDSCPSNVDNLSDASQHTDTQSAVVGNVDNFSESGQEHERSADLGTIGGAEYDRSDGDIENEDCIDSSYLDADVRILLIVYSLYFGILNSLP